MPDQFTRWQNQIGVGGKGGFVGGQRGRAGLKIKWLWRADAARDDHEGQTGLRND